MEGDHRVIPAEGGRPFQHTVASTSPAAGASFSHVLDPRYTQRLLSAVFTLTTSAVVASRYVTLEVKDGTNTAFVVNGAGVNVLASSTQRFVGSSERGQGEWATGTDVFFPLLPVELYGGLTLTINVANIDTTDQLSGIRLTFWRVLT